MICSNAEDVDPVPLAERLKESQSNRNGRLNRGMGVVVAESEIFEAEIVDAFHGEIQFHARERAEIAGELLAGLVEMVLVEVEVAERVDELAGPQIADLRHHHGEE